MRTVYTFWLRELKRYVRTPAQIFGGLGQPLLLFAALGLGLGPIFAQSGRGSYLQFLAPGVISMSVLFHAAFAGLALVWDRQVGFLKVALASPAPRSYIVLGRLLGGATSAVLQGTLVLLACLLSGFRPISLLSTGLALVTLQLVGTVSCALGTAIGSRLESTQSFTAIMNFFLTPMFFLSGALFPLEGLPKVLQVIAWANPFSYGVDGLRETLTGTAHFGVFGDLGVLALFSVVFVWASTLVFAKIQA